MSQTPQTNKRAFDGVDMSDPAQSAADEPMPQKLRYITVAQAKNDPYCDLTLRSSYPMTEEYMSTLLVYPNANYAATKLQNAWRRMLPENTTQTLAKQFMDATKSEVIAGMRFDDLKNHLRQSNVLNCTKAFVARLMLKCGEAFPSKTTKEVKLNTRKILASFFMIDHSDKVFAEMGQTEQTLLQASRDLRNTLSSLSETLASSGAFYECDSKTAESFKEVMKRYDDAFEQWRKPDEANLITKIQDALTILRRTQEQLDPHSATSGTLSAEFTKQIKLLQARLAKLTGQNTPESARANDDVVNQNPMTDTTDQQLTTRVDGMVIDEAPPGGDM